MGLCPSEKDMWVLAAGKTQSDGLGGNNIFYTPAPNLSTVPHNLALNFETLATWYLPLCQPNSHPTNPPQRGPLGFVPSHITFPLWNAQPHSIHPPESSSFTDQLLILQ